ncbi:NAD(P)-binding domain-containing protein, partial [Mesorhizobium sp.]
MTDAVTNGAQAKAPSGWRVAVLGGGAWGTALALAMLRAGHFVRLYARDPDTVAAIDRGENPHYLPGIAIEPGIVATSDIAAALDGANCVLAVTPAQSLRAVLAAAAGHVPSGVPLVLCAKGIERDTGALLSSIVEENLPDNPVAALSGPSFASDVARGLPTA